MNFYNYTFFRVYRFLKQLKSTNARNMAVGLVTLIISLAIFKVYTLIHEYILHKANLSYNEVALPLFLLVFFTYVMNTIIVEYGSGYRKVEIEFEAKGPNSNYDFVLIVVLAVIVVLFLV